MILSVQNGTGKTVSSVWRIVTTINRSCEDHLGLHLLPIVTAAICILSLDLIGFGLFPNSDDRNLRFDEKQNNPPAERATERVRANQVCLKQHCRAFGVVRECRSPVVCHRRCDWLVSQVHRLSAAAIRRCREGTCLESSRSCRSVDNTRTSYLPTDYEFSAQAIIRERWREAHAGALRGACRDLEGGAAEAGRFAMRGNLHKLLQRLGRRADHPRRLRMQHSRCTHLDGRPEPRPFCGADQGSTHQDSEPSVGMFGGNDCRRHSN